MTKINYDIALIGNAIVDIIAQTSDRMLKELLIEKGAMQIIDAEKADDLLKIIDNPIIVSGGSAANTAVGFSSFGGIACFLGQTGSDEFGTLFEKNINEAGVFFQRKQNNNLFEKTSKSIILVSPDAERSTAFALKGERRQREPALVVFSRLQLVHAVVDEELGPSIPVSRVDGRSVVTVQLSQFEVVFKVHHVASITLRQYSYMPRISVSVTM